METIPKQEVFSSIPEFLICSNCGKVYWEGSHHSKVWSQFENILTMTDTRPEELFLEEDPDEDW